MEYRIKAPAVKSCTETVSYVDLVGLYNFSLQVNVNIIQCNVAVLNNCLYIYIYTFLQMYCMQTNTEIFVQT